MSAPQTAPQAPPQAPLPRAPPRAALETATATVTVTRPIRPQNNRRQPQAPLATAASQPCGFCWVLFILGYIFLVLWFFFYYHQIKVAAETASLTRFNLTTNPNSLNFNLIVDISLRNPNKVMPIYYDWLEAGYFYHGHRFDSVTLPTFYQPDRNTSTLHLASEGQSAIALGGPGMEAFRFENETGFFNIEVWVFARMRYEVEWMPVFARSCTTTVRCELSVPLWTNGVPSTGFTRTDCVVVDY